ncbi:MAG: hypothetical protein JOZ18_10905, partial [Chloroflexi bacterium]|nr:hypothetical protein [Chloroflexota bacterium]
GSANRLPANLAAVQKAERASILAFARHSDVHPTLLQDLDAMGVKYRLARFPAEPGFDVMVVTPDRTLSPFDAESLGAWPFGC